MTDAALMDLVNEWLDQIEAKTSFRCPSENRKNTYTKACWLLALYYKLEYAGYRYGISVDARRAESIAVLKHFLPQLRRICTS